MKLTFVTFFRVFDLLSVASPLGRAAPARSLLGEGARLAAAVAFLVKACFPAHAVQASTTSDRPLVWGARKASAHLRQAAGHGWWAAGQPPIYLRWSASLRARVARLQAAVSARRLSWARQGGTDNRSNV